MNYGSSNASWMNLPGLNVGRGWQSSGAVLQTISRAASLQAALQSGSLNSRQPHWAALMRTRTARPIATSLTPERIAL